MFVTLRSVLQEFMHLKLDILSALGGDETLRTDVPFNIRFLNLLVLIGPSEHIDRF